ncbi:hypothetical protein OAT67_08870 [Bacteriovoracaceae bacterium]|nr:hypothetical protein [Bacteriovoracaceae bacterium]|tara:strand:- start:24089 stop:24277 length:189 start_codon:yes stop_codon:yes gene_type:complete
MDAKTENTRENVPVENLSELTGFPVDFIKKELLVDGESISIDDLRSKMITYLESNKEMFLKD